MRYIILTASLARPFLAKGGYVKWSIFRLKNVENPALSIYLMVHSLAPKAFTYVRDVCDPRCADLFRLYVELCGRPWVCFCTTGPQISPQSQQRILPPTKVHATLTVLWSVPIAKNTGGADSPCDVGMKSRRDIKAHTREYRQTSCRDKRSPPALYRSSERQVLLSWSNSLIVIGGDYYNSTHESRNWVTAISVHWMRILDLTMMSFASNIKRLILTIQYPIKILNTRYEYSSWFSIFTLNI